MDSPKPMTTSPTNPDDLELSPGFSHENLEGQVPSLATPDEIRAALEKAFDYRGDITLTLKNGEKVEGYVFDRRLEKTLEASVVRLIPKDKNEKLSVKFSDIAALTFGKDTAAGKSYETWIKKYLEKKAAGQTLNLEPEKLD